MGKPKPKTKTEMLNALCEARYTTELQPGPSSETFAEMLKDNAFAREARTLVSRKINSINLDLIPFQDGAAKINTQRG